MTARSVMSVGLTLFLLVTTGCAGDSAPSEPPTGAAATSSAGPATPSADAVKSATPRPGPTPLRLRRTTGKREVAFTFDDGPHPQWTPRLLDQLQAAGVKATFCLIGSKVRQHPDLVARIVREGHTLCNHSWRHDLELGSRSAAKIRADLVRTTREIQRAVPSAKVPFYRQPGGKWTAKVVDVARELGMRALHWDVDPRDWAKPTAKTITKRVTKRIRAGSIVLLHDGGGNRSATLAACPALIKAAKQRYGVTLLR